MSVGLYILLKILTNKHILFLLLFIHSVVNKYIDSPDLFTINNLFSRRPSTQPFDPLLCPWLFNPLGTSVFILHCKLYEDRDNVIFISGTLVTLLYPPFSKYASIFGK